MDLTFETSATPNADDLDVVREHLANFNDKDVGHSNNLPLVVLVRNPSGIIVSGISGYTAWGWLYIQWLWVDEKMRGQKLAGKMITAAEQEACQRGCHGALIDTFNPIAAKIYQGQGYKTFGVLDDFPIGRQRTFLQKKLTNSEHTEPKTM